MKISVNLEIGAIEFASRLQEHDGCILFIGGPVTIAFQKAPVRMLAKATEFLEYISRRCPEKPEKPQQEIVQIPHISMFASIQYKDLKGCVEYGVADKYVRISIGSANILILFPPYSDLIAFLKFLKIIQPRS